MRTLALILTVLASCTPPVVPPAPPLQSACAQLPAEFALTAGGPGCPDSVFQIPIENGCPEPVQLAQLEVRPSTLGRATQEAEHLRLVIEAEDGGVAEGSVEVTFADGSTASIALTVSRPEREKARFDLPGEHAVEVFIVVGEGVVPSAMREKFDSFLRLLGGWSFYRLHFITQRGGGAQFVTGEQPFLQSDSPDLEAKFDAFFAQVAPVPNVWDALSSTVATAAVQQGSTIELVIFGTGSEVAAQSASSWLSTVLPSGHVGTGLWLFASSASCPVTLGETWTSVLAAVPVARLLDLCVRDANFDLARLFPIHGTPPLNWSVAAAHLPSVQVFADDLPASLWTLEDTPNGPFLHIPSETFHGHRVISVRYDRLTSCESP